MEENALGGIEKVGLVDRNNNLREKKHRKLTCRWTSILNYTNIVKSNITLPTRSHNAFKQYL
jgi:hypothetical protein